MLSGARMGDWFKKHWGATLAAIAVALAFVKLAIFPQHHGHWVIFSGATHAIWSGVSPYGSDFGSGVGHYYYSPSHASIFFGIFGFFPKLLGLFLYSSLSAFVFWKGASAWISALKLNHQSQNLFWLLCTPHLLIGLLASRLEILTTGSCLLAFTWLLRNKGLLKPATTLGMISNWKLQPSATTALVAVALSPWRRTWKFTAISLSTFVAMVLFPLLFGVWSWKSWWMMHVEWLQRLSQYTHLGYLNFENIFAFLARRGMVLSYSTVEVIWLLTAVSLCGVILAMRRSREGLLMATFLGGAFSCLFSPLHQNNSYILLAPAYIWALFYLQNTVKGRGWILGMMVCLFFTSFAYSDLLPGVVRGALKGAMMKPFFLLLAMVLGGIFKVTQIGSPLPPQKLRLGDF